MEDETSPKNENASAAELNNTDGPHNVSLHSYCLKLSYFTARIHPSFPQVIPNEQHCDGVILCMCLCTYPCQVIPNEQYCDEVVLSMCLCTYPCQVISYEQYCDEVILSMCLCTGFDIWSAALLATGLVISEIY